jgi:hypothetical protein
MDRSSEANNGWDRRALLRTQHDRGKRPPDRHDNGPSRRYCSKRLKPWMPAHKDVLLRKMLLEKNGNKDDSRSPTNNALYLICYLAGFGGW